MNALRAEARREALTALGSIRKRVADHGSRLTNIYFVRRGDDGPVKIGSARNVTKRLNDLQVANAEPLRLLAVYTAPARFERELHDYLAADRIGGEWFAPSERVLAIAWVLGTL